ncbi:cellular tumor antigen p53-like isoform X2 [Varroa destructor]|uniref:p53 DNA-binding domain-containing protein n=1 Tax=Varroa destructor TaxID=109461 RepID=A0A7M7JZQ3_VARDE|nr:cellular tumor antigen p53-like isoform X2 [Varroa destructor]
MERSANNGTYSDWNQIELPYLRESVAQQNEGPFMDCSSQQLGLVELPPITTNHDLGNCRNARSSRLCENEQLAPSFDPNFVNGIDLVDRPGFFSFKLQVANAPSGEVAAARRESNYVYGAEDGRLHCKNEELVPLQVVLSGQLPPGLRIYLYFVFDEQAYRSENVETCPYHRTMAQKSKLNDPEFLIRAGDSDNAEYLRMPSGSTSAGGERHVLRVSLPPQTKNDIIRVKFKCRNSCSGGMNRRSTTLVGVLCSPCNTVLGVSFIRVKIVTCPVRDARKQLEKKAQEPTTTASSGSKEGRAGTGKTNLLRARRTKPSSSNRIRPAVDSSRRDTTESEAGNPSDNEEYIVHVRGRKNYQMLLMMAEGLELRRQKTRVKKPKVAEVTSANDCNNNTNDTNPTSVANTSMDNVSTDNDNHSETMHEIMQDSDNGNDHDVVSSNNSSNVLVINDSNIVDYIDEHFYANMNNDATHNDNRVGLSNYNSGHHNHAYCNNYTPPSH